jgi:hypothetical protein
MAMAAIDLQEQEWVAFVNGIFSGKTPPGKCFESAIFTHKIDIYPRCGQHEDVEPALFMNPEFPGTTQYLEQAPRLNGKLQGSAHPDYALWATAHEDFSADVWTRQLPEWYRWCSTYKPNAGNGFDSELQGKQWWEDLSKKSKETGYPPSKWGASWDKA